MSTGIEPDLQFSVLCDDVRIERSGKFIFVGVTEENFNRHGHLPKSTFTIKLP